MIQRGGSADVVSLYVTRVVLEYEFFVVLLKTRQAVALERRTLPTSRAVVGVAQFRPCMQAVEAPYKSALNECTVTAVFLLTE